MPVPISLPIWETLAPMLLPVVDEDVVSFFSTVFFSMVADVADGLVVK